MVSSPTDVLRTVVVLLDHLHIPYVIGGSFASMAYGRPRHTRDVDIVVDLHEHQIEALAASLEQDFYVSRDAMSEAIRTRGPFNAVHLESVFKVDFFVLGLSEFDQEEFRRRVPRTIEELGAATLMLKTPEDTILRKLDWFRAGGGVSEVQWQDVLAVLLLCQGNLDERYLDDWARRLGLSDLLARARREAPSLG